MTYQYKGVNINNMVVTPGSVNITSSYTNFPTFGTTTSSFVKIDNPLNYRISNTDIATSYSIASNGISYSTGTTSQGTVSVPSWSDAVKVYMYSAIGAQGAQGAQGVPGHADSCPMGQAKRPRAGGPGGAGGSGGAGSSIYFTQYIPLGSPVNYTVSNTSPCNITFANGGQITVNCGAQGAQGGQGNAGSNICQGDPGNTGVTGSQGAAGNSTTNLTQPNVVAASNNTSSYIGFYFFKV